MSSLSLSLDYTELVRKVGHFLGYMDQDDEITHLDEVQLADVDGAIQDGLRAFYSPARPHQWSFLRPLKAVTTAASVAEYPLPEEYAGIIGPLTVRTTTGSYGRVNMVNESVLREMRSAGGTGGTGRPCAAAIYPNQVHKGSRQTFTLSVWPTPDAAYTLESRWLVNPQRLSEDNPHPYGGAQHSLTVLEACLAEAERRLGDMDGIHRLAFQERLQASIEIDKQQSRPEHLGRNGDPNTPEAWMLGQDGARVRPDVSVTVNGTQYAVLGFLSAALWQATQSGMTWSQCFFS